MPIQEQRNPDEEGHFVGALCIDISLADETAFFPGKEKSQSQSLIFAEDEKYK